MRRSTLRLLTLTILGLVSAPVVMHGVLHDLDHHAIGHDLAVEAGPGHDEHEHPIVSSSAPRVPLLVRVELRVMPASSTPAELTRTLAIGARNVMAPGALRIDDDVGLQTLLSTFLI